MLPRYEIFEDLILKFHCFFQVHIFMKPRHYGLSVLRTQKDGPDGVRYNES